ncbi:NAD-dependent protein deacetylase sirtuin-1 [Nymphon striatum]|nr:NAD-dependent protein deacetylase sirtuin-1 [Nymphon striatum]
MVSIHTKMATEEGCLILASACKRQKLNSDQPVNKCEALYQNIEPPSSSGINNDRRSEGLSLSELEDMCNSNSADSGFSEISEKTPKTPVVKSSESCTFFPDKGMDKTPEQISQSSTPEQIDQDDSQWEDDDSSVSNLSGISDFKDLSHGLKPVSEILKCVQRQIFSGVNPRSIITDLLPEVVLPEHVDEILLWRLIIDIVSEPPIRTKLPNVNTIGDVVNLLRTSKHIIVLTGAGVSVSCGIPDFRSKDGIYARLREDFPDLPNPTAMFDIQFFHQNPRPFYKFAREIYPGQFKPSIGHRFIKAMEQNGKLLRNYTQNIDTLEQVAGIKSVIQCHGSFATASCTRCKLKVESSEIREAIFDQELPYCLKCEDVEGCSEKLLMPAIMKPDIVFFGEGLSDEFHHAVAEDKNECDLLIVIGSSLKVRPVALIPNSIPAHVPQILINREPLENLNFDVELLGDSDVIVNELALRLGTDWSNLCNDMTSLNELNMHEKNKPTDLNTETSDATSISSDLVPNSSSSLDELTFRCSCAPNLPDKTFAFEFPSRYIFKGAETKCNLHSSWRDHDKAQFESCEFPKSDCVGNNELSAEPSSSAVTSQDLSPDRATNVENSEEEGGVGHSMKSPNKLVDSCHENKSIISQSHLIESPAQCTSTHSSLLNNNANTTKNTVSEIPSNS